MPGQGVGIWKCQQNELDEVAKADCSKRSEQPQRTSGLWVMTWYVALRQNQKWRIWGLLWRLLRQAAWWGRPNNVVLCHAGNGEQSCSQYADWVPAATNCIVFHRNVLRLYCRICLTGWMMQSIGRVCVFAMIRSWLQHCWWRRQRAYSWRHRNLYYEGDQWRCSRTGWQAAVWWPTYHGISHYVLKSVLLLLFCMARWRSGYGIRLAAEDRGFTPNRFTVECDLGQVVRTHLPLSPGSIISYSRLLSS